MLNRRTLLTRGLTGAIGLAASSSALSSQPANPSFVFRTTPRPGVDPLAPAPRAPGGINPELFAKAKEALDRHSTYVADREWIGIADYGLRSDEARFHLVHLPSGHVESVPVTHGRGSDRNHNGYLDHFSNQPGSLATSSGAYLTASRYHGKYGLSAKLHGLDWSNNNAFNRAIVMHHAWYAEPEMISQHGKLGRSEGCFAFSRRDHWHVMSRLGEGRLIYADKLA
ncbi:murein L,D-transpeptidase catalytic domain family protein [Sphingomicrobium lutaoense]|uniref:L,D-transpeptidase catalytic domain n=1 Tax=Sphingomicrobium lutaoense TaxID=515949 RepID=A0A839YXS6_9SPHN|nr:murein L,D-transpeptidase catalytic domain family protein [Sphingomicrobium lutaoense]MBB3764991.1 hypothetical protein [Sphingomicrobium lutaoense]